MIETYTLSNKENIYTNDINIIKLFPLGEKNFMIYSNGIFKGILKYPSQYSIGIVKIKKEKEFWIIEHKSNQIIISCYRGKQGFELIYFQCHLLNRLQ